MPPRPFPVENGIARVPSQWDEEEMWVDFAVVLVHELSSGAEAVSTSAGLMFPATSVGEWAEAGCEGTVGSFISSETGCDAQDPHRHLSADSFPRSDLLEHAIRVAYATLCAARAPAAADSPSGSN